MTALLAKLGRRTVYAETGCWVWTGLLNRPGGYGRVSIGGGEMALTHRVAYTLLVGPIPEGLQIDHLCRVRTCWNPSHLELVPSKVNTLRGVGPTAVNAAKSHCKRGHLLSGENLYVEATGLRKCKECKREDKRRYLARLRAARVQSDKGSYPEGQP